MRFLVDFYRDHTPFSGHWHVIMMIFDVSENVRIIMFLVSLVFIIIYDNINQMKPEFHEEKTII